MRKLGKKVTLDKRSLQAYKFCVCSNCPCPSGTSSYSAKASDSERKAPTNQGLKQATYKLQMDKNFIDEEVRKCNAYSVHDPDSIKQFSEQLINTLAGYDDYPTL